MSDVLASFALKRAPLSVNAAIKKHYTSQLAAEFKKHGFPGAPFSGNLYLRVYYFHHHPDTRDADNFSKRVADALRGEAYEDDRIVIFRTAANIHMPEHPGVDLTRMQEHALSTFIDAQSNEEPVLYVEIGRFSAPMVGIGGI